MAPQSSFCLFFGEGGVAASSTLEREVTTENAVVAPRHDFDPQRVSLLKTKRIQVDVFEGKHATEQ